MNLLNRRRMMFSLLGGGGGLPADYQEVEYIQSDGTQVIDTGIALSPTISALARVAFTSVTSSWADAFGTYDVIGGTSLYWGFRGRNGTIRILAGNQAGTGWAAWDSSLTFSASVFFDVFLPNTHNKATYFTYNDVTRTDQSRLYTSPITSTIKLFSNQSTQGYAFKVASFILFDGDVEILHFVPCVRKADGVAGFYDLVAQTFISSPNNHPFIAGTN